MWLRCLESEVVRSKAGKAYIMFSGIRDTVASANLSVLTIRKQAATTQAMLKEQVERKRPHRQVWSFGLFSHMAECTVNCCRWVDQHMCS